MKALYMDTEQVSATNQLVEQKIEEIREELKDSKRSFRKMDWQSPTRDQMQGEFERVITQMNCLLDQGENLCQRLQREVQEWEAAGLHYLSVQGNAANPALSTESV